MHLPCPGTSNCIDAVRFSYIFQKGTFCHSKAPITLVYQEIGESGCRATGDQGIREKIVFAIEI
jgi:hypothetical protein